MICPKPSSKIKRSLTLELPVNAHELENLLDKSPAQLSDAAFIDEEEGLKIDKNGYEVHFMLEENVKRNGEIVEIYDFS